MNWGVSKKRKRHSGISKRLRKNDANALKRQNLKKEYIVFNIRGFLVIAASYRYVFCSTNNFVDVIFLIIYT